MAEGADSALAKQPNTVDNSTNELGEKRSVHPPLLDDIDTSDLSFLYLFTSEYVSFIMTI